VLVESDSAKKGEFVRGSLAWWRDSVARPERRAGENKQADVSGTDSIGLDRQPNLALLSRTNLTAINFS